MSHNNQALTIKEVWNETQRLNAEVAALQTRLSRYEDLERAVPSSTGSARRGENTEDATDQGVWDVWPYSWAISAYHCLRGRLHSFHQKLLEMRLAQFNKRARAAFWQQPHHEEITLRLVSGE